MKVEVFPSELHGVMSAPGSKSAAQRMIACALLARGESVITDYPDSKDCQAALQIAQTLGAIVTVKSSEVRIRGGFPNAFLSGIRNHRTTIECGESGLSSRMFTPIAALSNEEMTVNGNGTLLQRSFKSFEEILPAFGVIYKTENGCLPAKVKGPLSNGDVILDASESSQFLTGLLIALPRTNGTSRIEVTTLKSQPYIDMTLQIMKWFEVKVEHTGFKNFVIEPALYQPKSVRVPGDWSGAAFILVAGALCAKDGLRIENLDSEFIQADRAILKALKLAGVAYEEEKNAVTIKSAEIHAFEFDANDCPDLFPPLAALAAFANGVSTIYGVKRLADKESNRGKVLQQEFAKANIRIVIREDEMKIYPAHVGRAVINSHNDHRIAMASAILGLAGDRIVIQGAQCVSKSFPEFFNVLMSLNGKLIVNP